jgi:thiamine pyrophosphate-dependent acetolactate synthase large subunit-like protein
MRVYEAVGDALGAEDVERIFGVMGETNMFFVHRAVTEHGVKLVSSVREDGGVMMADAWARLTGRTGVATVTCGPALTNSLTALTEAVKVGTPLVLLTGDVSVVDWWHPQSFDIKAGVLATGAGYQRVRAPQTAPEDLAIAFRRAVDEQRPIVFDLPGELQFLDCPAPEPVPRLRVPPQLLRPDPDAVRRAADVLERAERPVIIAGRGAVHARDALTALAERTGALLASSLRARRLFAGDPFDVGISGGYATTIARRLLADADCALVVGASLNTWTAGIEQVYGPAQRLIPAEATIIHADISPRAPGGQTRADQGLLGDAEQVARALLEELERRGHSAAGFRTDDVRAELAAFDPAAELVDRSTGNGLDLSLALARLNEVLPKARVVASDAGHFTSEGVRYVDVADTHSYVHAVGFGGVGLGLAAAIGAAYARPDLTPVAIVGDGGLTMSLAELDTIRRERLDIVVLVVNDGAYGAEYHNFRFMGLPPDLSLFDRPDYAAIARAFGGQGVTIDSLTAIDELRPLVDPPRGLVLVDVHTDPAIMSTWFAEADAIEVD